ITQETRAKIAIEQIMFEAVAEASKTPVARSVTAFRATFEQLERPLEDRNSQLSDAAGESSASGERVIEIDLRLEASLTKVRQCGPILSLYLSRLQFQLLRGGNRDRLGERAQRDITRQIPRPQGEWRFDASRDEQHIGHEVCSENETSRAHSTRTIRLARVRVWLRMGRVDPVRG